MKHAAARSATIDVTHEADGVRLRMSNLGPVAAYGEGQGIPGMKERARLYGGTVSAEPTSPDGWQVEAWLPYGCEETTLTLAEAHQ